MPDTTTLGVEEEYLLVDGEGLPVARSAQVLARARGDDGIGDADLQHELLEVQVEVRDDGVPRSSRTCASS